MTFIRFIIVLAIAYGSLFPFNFRFEGLDATATEKFLNSWQVSSSRGDLRPAELPVQSAEQ